MHAISLYLNKSAQRQSLVMISCDQTVGQFGVEISISGVGTSNRGRSRNQSDSINIFDLG